MVDPVTDDPKTTSGLSGRGPLSAIVCTKCGADLHVEEGVDRIVCEHCGATIARSDVAPVGATQAESAPSEPEAPPVPGPRTWPTWVVLFLILPLGLLAFTSVFMIIAMLIMEGPELLKDPEGLQGWIQEIATQPLGVLILIAPGQLFFLALTIAAALPSPDPLSKRLGFVRPRGSLRTWILLCLGSPIVQFAGFFLAGMFFDLSETSEQLEMLSGLFTSQSGFLGVTLLILFASVFPGFSEELFFRGYIRVGLGRRWGFMVAVLIPALVFAAVHMDPMHATAILPLGVWFGCLAWWSRSTIPAIGAHLMNNLFAIIVSREASALEGDSGPAEATAAMVEFGTFALVGYGACLLLLFAGLWSLFIERARDRVESVVESP